MVERETYHSPRAGQCPRRPRWLVPLRQSISQIHNCTSPRRPVGLNVPIVRPTARTDERPRRGPRSLTPPGWHIRRSAVAGWARTSSSRSRGASRPEVCRGGVTGSLPGGHPGTAVQDRSAHRVARSSTTSRQGRDLSRCQRRVQAPLTNASQRRESPGTSPLLLARLGFNVVRLGRTWKGSSLGPPRSTTRRSAHTGTAGRPWLDQPGGARQLFETNQRGGRPAGPLPRLSRKKGTRYPLFRVTTPSFVKYE